MTKYNDWDVLKSVNSNNWILTLNNWIKFEKNGIIHEILQDSIISSQILRRLKMYNINSF